MSLFCLSHWHTHIQMAGETVTQTKWEGKACVELAIPTAQEVWPLVEDFCNLHKWLPTIDTCYQVDGILGQPGMVRYVATTTTTSSNGNEETMIKWAKEKLLMIDPIKRCLSYEIIDNNIGMKSYVGKFIVSPINDDGKKGCKMEWSFVCDPIEGLRFEDFLPYIETGLQSMAKKMEDALLSTRWNLALHALYLCCYWLLLLMNNFVLLRCVKIWSFLKSQNTDYIVRDDVCVGCTKSVLVVDTTIRKFAISMYLRCYSKKNLLYCADLLSWILIVDYAFNVFTVYVFEVLYEKLYYIVFIS